MPKITETARIRMNADRLWHEIGDFGAVGEWHPMLEAVDVRGEGQGAMRVAHGKSGDEQTERLQQFSPSRHMYRYTLEHTAMPVCNYSGEFRIVPETDSRSCVVWSVRFELTADGSGKDIESVREFLHTGTESLKGRYGSGS